MNESVKKLSLRSLAIPILVEQILRNLMGTVNVFMLGRISDDAVAAVGVANQIMNIVVCAFTFLGIGAAVLINHAIGARRMQDSAILSMNAITVAAIIGAAFSAALIFGAPFFIRAVGLGYLFTVRLGLGVAGLYLGIMVDEWVRGGSMLILWIRRVWVKGLVAKHEALRRAEVEKASSEA